MKVYDEELEGIKNMTESTLLLVIDDGVCSEFKTHRILLFSKKERVQFTLHPTFRSR